MKIDDLIQTCETNGIPSDGWKLYLNTDTGTIYRRIMEGVVTHTAYCTGRTRIYGEGTFCMRPLAIQEGVA